MTLSRRQLAALLLVQAAVVLPHASRLPGAALLVWALIVFWYFQIWRQRWSLPGGWVKLALVVISLAALALHYDGFLALEAQIAVVVCGLSLKLLELKSRRDVWIVLAIAYFLVAGQFLFEQQMIWLLVSALQLCALLMLHQQLHATTASWGGSLRRAMLLLLQSLPILVFLFLLFPRMGPLWSVPLPGSNAVTGLSDEMSPGDVARLSRSGALAFRAEFDAVLPMPSQLYWRGLVLEYFDGRRWSRHPVPAGEWQPRRPAGDALSYSLTLEPGVHAWVPALSGSYIERNDMELDRRGQWLPDQVLTGRLHYRARADFSRPAADPVLSERERRLNLYTPPRANPRSKALADSWRQSIADPEQRVSAVLQWWRQQPLVYTLNPPLLGQHSVDEFLFDSQRGFCEHFAGAMAFLLRSAGVPARIVLGYQGGERNPLNSTLLVHQSDAHAWLEYWTTAGGWQRLDPTALLVPARIEQGAGEVLSAERGYLSDGINLRRFRWANQMRFWMDSLEYNWARWVLNFDQEDQWQILRNWEQWKLPPLHWLLGVFAGIGLIVSLIIRYRERSRLHPLEHHYERLTAPLRRAGLQRRAGETPRQFARRVRAVLPEHGEWIDGLTGQFERARYGQQARADSIDDADTHTSAHLEAVRQFKRWPRLRYVSVK